MTAPMRPRTFFAVTGFVDQIGNRMLITSAEVISLTRRAPILVIFERRPGDQDRTIAGRGGTGGEAHEFAHRAVLN